jgi:hypothetical protein
LGPLNLETRQGLYLHPTLAVTPERLCLGLLNVHRWVREPGSLGQDKDPNRPLEEKESVRWVDGYRQVDELAEQLPDTRLAYVADREADIYDLFVEAPCPEFAADWLVRAQHDRVLANGKTLRQHLAEAPALTETTFERPASHGVKARTVHQQIRTVRVTLPAPRRPDRILPDVDITAILATEPHPPAGEEPVEWLLLTSLLVDTTAQALEKLQWYLCRWQIDIDQSCCLRKAVIRTWKGMLAHRYAGGWPSRAVPCGVHAGVRTPAHRPTPASGRPRPGGPGGHAPSPYESN